MCVCARQANPLLFLYRNAPTVVLGRNQNPWKQCRMEGMRAAGVQLARRNSGGGTTQRGCAAAKHVHRTKSGRVIAAWRVP